MNDRGLRVWPTMACALLALAGCDVPLQTAAPSPQPSADAVAACDSRADEEFSRQNRAAVYQSDRYTSSIRDSPFGAQGLPGSTTSLSNQYERTQDVRSCLNGTATPIEPEPAATKAP